MIDYYGNVLVNDDINGDGSCGKNERELVCG
jgi:hypothetical protein